jgi:Protein of unknown function (DUF1488)
MPGSTRADDRHKHQLRSSAEKVGPMRIWLNVVPGSIVVAPDRLLFQCSIGEKSIACSITAEALDDIVHFYRLDVSRDEAFDTLVKEIERTANGKFGDGRVERDGQLAIRSLDVLRYGLQKADPTTDNAIIEEAC